MERTFSFKLQALLFVALVSVSCLVNGVESEEDIILRQAVANMRGKGIKGKIFFTEIGDGPTNVNGSISGLPPGPHGLHIHEGGNPFENCLDLGRHFNPAGNQHGDLEDENRHAGDLGNIIADADGNANFHFSDDQISLSGPDSILGRAIDVHQECDDLGRGGYENSRTTANSGTRIACGVIWDD